MLPQPEVLAANGTTTLLDVQLGKGFALLAINCPTFDLEAVLGHRPWRALSVQGMHVVSAGMQRPLSDSYLIPIDNRFDEIMRLHHGEVILLRPDRYIVGSVRPEELEALALNVERLLGV
jgi:3-(3-hydroxy-phenyl)propionate hydroxylase